MRPALREIGWLGNMADRGRQRSGGRGVSLGLAVAVALAATSALAASASAAGVHATVAPISGVANGYLVVVKNEEAEKTPGETEISAGEAAASNVAPSTCTWNQPLAGAIGCPQIPAGGTLELCYTGDEVTSVQIFYVPAPVVSFSKAGPVGSCPVAGFNPSKGGGGGGSNEGNNQPAASFTLGKAKANAKKGTATLNIDVPGPGSLKLSGKGVKSSTKNATAAGTVGLPVKASGKAAKNLAKNGKVTVKVTVTFTPTGGTASKLTKTVKLLEN